VTYENRKTGKLYEVTVTRKGRVYLKGHGGESRSVPEGHLSKSYKQHVPKIERPEPRPSSVAEAFARTGPPPKPVGVLHEPVQRDRFTPVVLGLGCLIIAAIIVLWAITR
jgi:hypothetical protein